ncbi:MAG: HesA/MoeB/ThiF family protein, partial [Anaerolineae bacterium]|nr:HesA/MoeB/ThiF family protein [Anaerolineae bacterium]
SRVLVVGCGGLGSPVLLYLAAAGVGTLGLADGDKVALSNLNRQILYVTQDLGRSKALAAVQRVRALNPEVQAIPHEERVLQENGAPLVRQYDLVVEASDNLETKDLMNALCVEAGIPLVWGAVERFDGQLGVVMPGHACRRCIFPKTPEPGTYPTPAELGIAGATAGVIGALQAEEALKILLEVGQPLVDRLLLWEGLSQTFDIVHTPKNPACSVCGKLSG